MPILPNGPAPYPPSGKLVLLVERHRDTGLPTPLTVDKVARLINSPGLAPRVMKALELFDLVDENGEPTNQFDALAKAPTDAEYHERFADLLRAAYADVFQYIDPTTATHEQIEGQFRNYTPRGQIARMVALFRGLCEYAGIPLPASEPERSRSQSTAKTAQLKPEPRKKTEKTTRASDRKSPDPPPTVDGSLSDQKQRYLDLLLKKAEQESDPNLFDRIERVLGVPPTDPRREGGESSR